MVPLSSPPQQYLGRPSTKTVGILSDLITDLATATKQHLNLPLEKVVVTTPGFPALSSEDLNDAIEYAGLESWLTYPLPYPEMLYTQNAAYAGNGMGLCRYWEHIYACLDEVEEGKLPAQNVYAVTFTNTTLLTSITRIDYAFSQDHDQHLAFPHVGLNSLNTYPSDLEYWSQLRQHLQMLLRSSAAVGHPITSLVLTGENAAMPEFRVTLKAALGELQISIVSDDRYVSAEGDGREGETKKVVAALMTDPLWAAARGAARYARIRQQIPWNCVESVECEEEGR